MQLSQRAAVQVFWLSTDFRKERLKKICLVVKNNRLGINTLLFLGAFAKFRKAIISFVMSIRLSVDVEHLCSYWKDFHEI
jgi:hypothetical protein